MLLLHAHNFTIFILNFRTERGPNGIDFHAPMLSQLIRGRERRTTRTRGPGWYYRSRAEQMPDDVVIIPTPSTQTSSGRNNDAADDAQNNNTQHNQYDDNDNHNTDQA